MRLRSYCKKEFGLLPENTNQQRLKTLGKESAELFLVTLLRFQQVHLLQALIKHKGYIILVTSSN